MEPCESAVLQTWLTEKLVGSSLSEYIPRSNLTLVCQQIVAGFYRQGRLETVEIFGWLEKEYELPREELVLVLTGLKKEATRIGVNILLPWETHAGVQSAEAPAASAPPTVAPAASAPPTVAPPADRSPAPRTADPRKDLSAFMNDPKYFEWAVLDHVKGEGFPKEGPIDQILREHFEFAGEEIGIMRGLEPGAKGENIDDWILRLNGLALALNYALALTQYQMEYPQEWLRGVRQLNTRMGEITGKVLNKQQKAKNDPSLPLLRAAWTWGKEAMTQLELEAKRVQESIGQKASAPPPPAEKTPAKPTPPPAAAPKTSAFEGRNKLLTLVAGAIILASFIWMLSALGILSGGDDKQEVTLDFSGIALPVQWSYTSSGALVVVTEETAWQALDEAAKVATISRLYRKAAAAGQSQLQLRTAANNILAHAWSEDNFKIFSRAKK
jgi:hypothetical protein